MFKSFVFRVHSESQIHDLVVFCRRTQSKIQDFEIIAVDNSSHPTVSAKLFNLVESNALINTRVLSIASMGRNHIDPNWAGVHAAIGDRVAVIELNEATVLSALSLSSESEKYDAYFGVYPKAVGTFAGRLRRLAFRKIYRAFTGVQFPSGQIAFTEMSKSYVHFLSKSPNPEIALRNAPLIIGFNTGFEDLVRVPKRNDLKSKPGSFDRASEILFTASKSPMRFISYVAVLGALLNLLYSLYVIITGLTQEVEAGWTSLSLQISGMFFIFSLVLAGISEFLIILSKNQSAGNGFFVREETSSANIGLASKLNVKDETVDDKSNE